MSAAAQSSLSIATPEGVVFSYQLATPVSRCFAWIIDAVAIGGMTYFVSRVVNIAGFLSADFANFLSVVLYFVISVGYGILLEWRWRGQTLGKRVFGLRVIDVHGFRLQFPQIALRNLLRPIDSLPLFYLVGGVAALATRWGQRLGDLAANTVVAHERYWDEPNLDPLAPAKYNSLLAYPRLAGRLRTLANPEAVAFALRAVTGRDSYQPAARLELFAELADYFRSLAHFPEAAIEGLSDEQFVGAVLRVIYHAPGRPHS
ncbi:MAG TPA: RDD family protein [Bryobacteraceae bacterium]|nr:RDD family protein [Bryobacteraceae bacterium]